MARWIATVAGWWSATAFMRPREVTTAAGAVPVRQPRVNDKRIDEVSGERRRFASAILPAWSRRARGWRRCCRCCICTACPAPISGRRWSSSSAPTPGLSAATITRLTAQWQDEARAFNTRSLAETDYVYCWVDGIVRHEALHDRVGVRDLHRRAVVAAR